MCLYYSTRYSEHSLCEEADFHMDHGPGCARARVCSCSLYGVHKGNCQGTAVNASLVVAQTHLQVQLQLSGSMLDATPKRLVARQLTLECCPVPTCIHLTSDRPPLSKPY
jgi:hypothetical protein